MSGAIIVDTHGLDDARRAIARLSKFDLADLLDVIGTEVVDQTKDRIGGTKTSPDGAPWPVWSAKYGARRPAGKSLLQDEGHLLNSIQQHVSGSKVSIGSHLPYAAIHQFGGAEVGRPGLKPRPYLGLSDSDSRDLQQVVNDYLSRLTA